MQLDFFSDSPPATTALYPNRQRDKARVELELGLPEHGTDELEFLTPKGALFALGYVRIVYGDHGPYIEFRRDHIRARLRPRFNRPVPADAYYEWLEPTDGSAVKVYDQRRDVRHLKNPPKGGYQGHRAEGYADYVPGMLYVSPYELRVRRAA